MNEKKINILLVEDEESHADLICRSFKSNIERMSVTVAYNLNEARNSISKSTPDLIIADFLLPDGKGIELIPAKREESPYPIIILTSHGDEKIAVEAMKAGAFDYIVKSEVTLDDMPRICERIMREWSQITEQKKTEEALSKSEEKYRNLVETAQDAIVCDVNGIIVDWNKSAERVFGYSKDEIIGKPIEILIPDRYKKEHQEGLEQFIKTGKGRIIGKTVEVSGITKEGLEIPIEISLTAQKIEEEKYLFTAVIRDLTERKKMEEALLQSEKLKSIGTITSGVAHEFNNILAIISGNAQLLEASYKDHEELTKALRTIKRATNDGAEISRRMLKFTRTAKDTAGFEPFDINELINQAIDFTKPRWKNMAQAKGINYCMDTEGMKRVPSILCNHTELREVFVNIINNALDAMPDGGTITVATRCVRSKELGVESKKENASKLKTQNSELKGDFVEITFADNGEGMSEEVKKNIFDPFFTTKGVVGTGLGMSTAYGIVTGHGGKIEVESEVGRGSTFTLQFPADTKTDSPKESSEPEQEIMNKCLRILVVDDEEEICNILDKFFSKKGHMVRTVDNGREAIILTKVTDYDLVLCDMAMPEVFGYDVIKTLNKLEKRPKIGIITGWGDKLMPPEEEGLKVDFIIRKPFDFSELTKHINELGIKELRD